MLCLGSEDRNGDSLPVGNDLVHRGYVVRVHGLIEGENHPLITEIGFLQFVESLPSIRKDYAGNSGENKEIKITENGGIDFGGAASQFSR